MYKLFIVDDNRKIANSIREMLPWSSLGIEVAGCFYNAQEAIESLVNITPDIVLTDIVMPMMDGIGLATELRKRLPVVKIIFMSCFDEFDYARSAVYLDIEDYILKPLVEEDLERAIRKALRKCELEESQKKEKAELMRETEEMKRQINRATPPNAAEGINPKLNYKDNESTISNKENTQNEKIVRDIKAIIEKRYSEKITIDDMLEAIYLSPGHANVIFKRVTGKTIFDYLTEYRLERAKILLRDPYSKIYLVANDVGYSNKSHFCSLFKKYTGYTPAEFKEKGLEI